LSDLIILHKIQDKVIKGVYHTGLVAFNSEWFFGNDGIRCCLPVWILLHMYRMSNFKPKSLKIW